MSIPVLFGISQLHEGGSERQLYELAHRIAPFGFQPHVFTLTPGGVFSDALERAGVPVFPLHRRTRLDPLPTIELWQILRRHHIQILHTYDFYAGLFGRSAAFAAGTPVRIHSERAVRAEGRANKSDAYFAADRLLARGTYKIIANADAVKAFAVQDKGLPAHKINVVYNGLNEAWFRHPDAQAVAATRGRMTEGRVDKLVGIVARFDPMKDHATFFQAAQLVLQTYSSTRFVVIGKGALEGELQRMVDDLGIRQNVLFAGALFGDDLMHTVRALDVVMSTSKSGEGCSNAILEAMALGKAIVASRVGGTPELIVDGESGLLVNVGDVQGFADAMRRLLSDDALRQRVGTAAAERVQTCFSVDRMVEDTLKIYEQAMRQSRNKSTS